MKAYDVGIPLGQCVVFAGHKRQEMAICVVGRGGALQGAEVR